MRAQSYKLKGRCPRLAIPATLQDSLMARLRSSGRGEGCGATGCQPLVGVRVSLLGRFPPGRMRLFRQRLGNCAMRNSFPSVAQAPEGTYSLNMP